MGLIFTLGLHSGCRTDPVFQVFQRRAYFFLTSFFFFGDFFFFLGALAWSFLEFLLKIEFSRRASSNFHKTSCFSVKLLQISIKNPLKLVFSSNEEGRKEGRKEERNPALFLKGTGLPLLILTSYPNFADFHKFSCFPGHCHQIFSLFVITACVIFHHF